MMALGCTLFALLSGRWSFLLESSAACNGSALPAHFAATVTHAPALSSDLSHGCVCNVCPFSALLFIFQKQDTTISPHYSLWNKVEEVNVTFTLFPPLLSGQ